MRTLYFECNMGAAGDMLMAALSELLDDKEGFVKKLNEVGIPGLIAKACDSEKCGIKGTHMEIIVAGEEEESVDVEVTEHHHEDHHHDHEHSGHHHHYSLADVKAVIDRLNVSDKVKENAWRVYSVIADAESAVHGKPVSDIHFHEVGSLDAIADVVGVCMLMEEVGAVKVYASPIHVGSGQVKCAHGILPVPAPATAKILEGIPTYGGRIKGELCTPTGAALLKCFVDEFGQAPVMTVNKIGYGMGKKDFEWANCVRVMLGETADDKKDTVTEFVANIDDMTPEDISFACELFMNEGALDAFTQPIFMKKGRQATCLTVMCKPKDADKFAKLIFTNTTTIGVREYETKRRVLTREIETVNTKYGEVKVKKVSGYGTERCKPEFDDLARISKENNITIAEARREVLSGK